MVVIDDNVKRVMERRDLDTEEKIILIDLLMREPKPEEETDELGNKIILVGMAKGTESQIAGRTRLSESTVRRRLKELEERKFVTKKSGKGRHPNRYTVKFPKHEKSRPSEDIPLPDAALQDKPRNKS